MKRIKIIGALVLIAFIGFYNANLTKRAINECVQNGNDYNFCAEKLK